MNDPVTNPDAPPPYATIRRAAAAGHVEAQLLLGQMLLDGSDRPADPAQAVRWFAIAAEAGHAPAMNMLGRCHEHGWGTAPAPEAAARCYGLAAAAGDDWGRYNLANMRLRGRGIARDRPEAWRLFHAAACAGHAKSMNLVARFLDEGWDRPRDPGQALHWYRRAAEAGDHRGCHNLATALAEHGRLDEALGWWGRAVAQATPDILRAMAAAIAAIPHPDAPALLRQVAARLPAPAPVPAPRRRPWWSPGRAARLGANVEGPPSRPLPEGTS